ncbi:type VI secretion system baseplate subunit TssG [Hydromonas duriensis]|uniref:Type VI secretion system protein ImpH n=1 Tax=Hydromonas duriensis TaxID=1527608 RepID=A0A4R6YBS5_9BURK|nr:type VI secretion system baseplate subunit TssG [Hydromonas duriensis]TDR33059.1 type VI secretion system protein ImpH [Hydromonas duriensis]
MTETTAKQQQTHRYIHNAQEQPWNHGFTRMLRWFGARYHFLPAVGAAAKPSEEVLRIGQLPSLIFSPREIAEVSIQKGKTHVKTYGLGLWGPNGPLPLHFSEMAMHRREMQHDHTLTNFIDIFHHRSMSLFYRAWEINQSTAGLDRKHNERFSRYLAWLTGNDLTEMSTTHLPTHAQLSAAAHIKHQSKNPSGIAQTLSQYYQVPVELEEYYFNWITVDQEDCTYLARGGRSGSNASLGQGAMLGEYVPDKQSAFLLTIGPLSLSQYLRFLPNGDDLGSLIDWVRAFTGLEYMWMLKLLVKQDEATPTQLGGTQQLGWSSWMSGDESVQTKSVTGMLFEPEKYISLVKQLKREKEHKQLVPASVN